MTSSANLRSGTCPHCGAHEIYKGSEQGHRGAMMVGLLSGIQIEAYICVECGAFEESASLNPALVEKIKKNWTKI
jgi:DNA-directed RNA polymerase subunit RPC12/RpoP